MLVTTFTILEFRQEADPDVVYAETLAGKLYIEHEDDLGRNRSAFDAHQNVALNPE
jgi:hypothetical protein